MWTPFTLKIFSHRFALCELLLPTAEKVTKNAVTLIYRDIMYALNAGEIEGKLC
jgi:hypothetical protein